MRHERTFTYIGIAAIVLLLFGLGGWYLFIARQTANIENSDLARGFNINIPSFAGTRGSTAANIASGFGVSEPRQEESMRPSRLWNINATPVAGFNFVPHGTSSLIRFVERSTGHVFDADPETGSIIRRTNTLLPQVYDARVYDETIVERFLENDVVMTFVGQFGTTTEEGTRALEGANLGGAVDDIALTPSGLLFLTSDTRGTHLIRANLDGTAPEELLSLGAGNFKLILTSGGIVLIERGASGIQGNAYAVSSEGVLTPLVRNVTGLTLVPHGSSTALLVGADSGQSLSLALRPAEGLAIPLSLQTVADKCVWAPGTDPAAYCAVPQAPVGTAFLNNWYRGKIHTADTWFLVNGNTGATESIFAMQETAIDVEHPAVDGSGKYLAFMNASDKSLWLLRIHE